MAKWIAAEKARAGPRHRVVSMPERDGKDQGQSSPKQACLCLFATSGANLYPPGVWFADVMSLFSGVSFSPFSFCFVFVVLLFIEAARPFVQSSFDVHAPRQLHAVT